MFNKATNMTVVGLVLGLSACQSTPSAPVLKRADNTFETTGLGDSKVNAQKNALESAKKQCGTKTPIILSDTTTYHGMVVVFWLSAMTVSPVWRTVCVLMAVNKALGVL